MSFPFSCALSVSLSTQHFTVHIPPLMAEHHLTLHRLSLYFLVHPFPIAVPSIFSYIVNRASYTLFDGRVFFLMACPLLDHILVPLGVPNKSRKQSGCLLEVVLLLSSAHENGLKSIAAMCLDWSVGIRPSVVL